MKDWKPVSFRAHSESTLSRRSGYWVVHEVPFFSTYFRAIHKLCRLSRGGGKKLQILQNKKTTILRRHSLWTAPFVNDYFDRFLLSFTMWQGHENSDPIGLNSRRNFKQRPFKFHLAFWRTTYWLKFLFSDISFKAFLKHKFSIGLMSKGQLISEWLFGVFKFSKKQTKKFDEIPP